jgi:sugar/nucleoside kinase (ribokinase family)
LSPAAAGITVLGNFSVDRVDDGPPTPGGCPVFAAMALGAMAHPGRVVARLSRADLPLFQPVFDRYGDLISPLWTPRTSSFALRYQEGGGRRLNVNSIGEPWAESEIDAAEVDTEWAHLAPLLRGDFPLEFLRAMRARGHRISLDGQGLVRVPRLGPLHLDGEFDRALLEPIEVLKLNQSEAEALAGGPFDTPTATRLGIAEVLVTFGAGGCDLYLDGERHHIPARAVADVQTTGTGDAFMVSYLGDRAAGVDPLRAAERASAVVADILEDRRAGEAPPPPSAG